MTQTRKPYRGLQSRYPGSLCSDLTYLLACTGIWFVLGVRNRYSFCMLTVSEYTGPRYVSCFSCGSAAWQDVETLLYCTWRNNATNA